MNKAGLIDNACFGLDQRLPMVQLIVTALTSKVLYLYGIVILAAAATAAASPVTGNAGGDHEARSHGSLYKIHGYRFGLFE